MKFSVLWVSLAIAIFTVSSTVPQKSLAITPYTNLNQPQLNLNKEIPANPPDQVTLNWALEASIKHHPSLAVSWYEIKARQGETEQAGLLSNPTLFGELEEFGGSKDFSGTGAMSSRIGISQELPLGGKISKRVREAKTAIRIANLEHQAKTIEVKALVEKRFFTVFSLQEKLKLHVEQLELIQKVHEVVTKRVKSGDTSPLDLAKSQIEMVSTKIEIEQIRKEFEAAKYALAESWGSQHPMFSNVSAKYQPAPGFTEQDLEDALKQSPSWLLMETQFEKANASLDLAIAQSIPDLELEGGVQHFNESKAHAFFLGLSIPIPLFDRNQGKISEARALSRKMYHEREVEILALRTTLQEAWLKLSSTKQAVQSLEQEVLPVARNSYESISIAYKAGELDILSLLDAQRTWVDTRKVHLDLLHGHENSKIEIKRLIGRKTNIGPIKSSYGSL